MNDAWLGQVVDPAKTGQTHPYLSGVGREQICLGAIYRTDLFSGQVDPASVGLKLPRRYFRRLGGEDLCFAVILKAFCFCKSVQVGGLFQLVGEFCVLFMRGLIGLLFTTLI